VSLTDPQDTLTVRYGGTLKGISPGVVRSVVFGPDARFADGEGGVWVGDTALERVEFVDNAGELKRVVKWTSSVDRAFGSDRQAAFWSAAISASSQHAVPLPDSLPAFFGLRAGGGRLWVRTFQTDDVAAFFHDRLRRAEWMVCDFASNRCGLVHTPDGFSLYIVGHDYVIAKFRDEFQVERIARCKLSEVGQDPGGVP
jgi:hypothetical protein